MKTIFRTSAQGAQGVYSHRKQYLFSNYIGCCARCAAMRVALQTLRTGSEGHRSPEKQYRFQESGWCCARRGVASESVGTGVETALSEQGLDSGFGAVGWGAA